MSFQPERINPDLNQKGYSVKSDIWSLGITMVSLKKQKTYKMIFLQNKFFISTLNFHLNSVKNNSTYEYYNFWLLKKG